MTREFENVVVAVSHAKDGDTACYTIQLTPTLREDVIGRILGFDCPETRRPASDFERTSAKLALAFTRAFITGPGALWSRREMVRDAFGRDLVTLWHEVGEIRTDLGEALFDACLATRWPTKWYEVYDPTGRL